MAKKIGIKESWCKHLLKKLKIEPWRVKDMRTDGEALYVELPDGEVRMELDNAEMTSHYAIEVIKDEKACVKRNIDRENGVYDSGCDRDCLHCDLLHTDEDILMAYDMSISGLEADIWIRATDTPKEVATALFESIKVTDKIEHCFSKRDLREIANYLYAWTT